MPLPLAETTAGSGPPTAGARGSRPRARDVLVDQPVERLEAEVIQYDHIQPYNQGGPTVIANLQRLCGPHNRGRVAPGATMSAWRER